MSATWDERFTATVKRVANDLSSRRRLAAEGSMTLAMPPGFAAELARVVAWERERGDGKDRTLEQLFLDSLPTLRVHQALDRGEPIRTLFHTPVEWHAMPRLTAALTAIFLALQRLGAPNALGFSSLTELATRHATLDSLCAATYYGRFLPLLYAYPPDLAYASTLLAAGMPLPTVLDRHFASPIVHELMHFGADREPLPAYLDECIAGYFGVYFLPSMAFPAPNTDGGLYAAPNLSQVGQWLARCFDFDAVLAAQAGLRTWPDVLGERFTTLIQFAREDYAARRPAHLLSDNFAPQRWLKVIAGLAPDAPWSDLPSSAIDERDWAIVCDGLRAMCLWPAREHDTFRVATAMSAPATIDLVECAIQTTATFDGHAPRYLFPPAIAERLRARGHTTLTLPPIDPLRIDEVALDLRRLLD